MKKEWDGIGRDGVGWDRMGWEYCMVSRILGDPGSIKFDVIGSNVEHYENSTL